MLKPIDTECGKNDIRRLLRSNVSRVRVSRRPTQEKRNSTIADANDCNVVLHDFSLRAFCFQDYDIFLTNN